ncbi:MAG TPA: response regulator [Sphingomonas sp.]|nr:response regulator [Sphingomonas sp.]
MRDEAANILSGKVILVAEDEYMVAEDVRGALVQAGAYVVGPTANVTDALALIDGSPRIDAALLDVNLGGELVFPVADRLMAAAVPFVFTTGYDRRALPERFAAAPRCEKPVTMRDVTTALRGVLGRR